MFLNYFESFLPEMNYPFQTNHSSSEYRIKRMGHSKNNW